MIDFPANPQVGDVFQSWKWDGEKWAPHGGSGGGGTPFPEAPTDGNAYMRSDADWASGGTLTDDLYGQTAHFYQVNAEASFGSSNLYPTGLTFNAAAQYYGVQLIAQYFGLNRWVIDMLDGSPESGGNAGNNLDIRRADDSGSNNPDPVLTIDRATGLVTIPNLASPSMVPGIGDNRLINGDMRINQRGADGYTMGVCVVDRWWWVGYSGIGGGANPTGTGICVPMQNGPPEFPYCLGVNMGSFALAAGDYFQVYQAIEADMVGDFAWGTPDAKTVTLSFWAMAYNTAGTYGGSITNSDATRSYAFSYSLPDIQVWHKIAITIPGDQAGTWTLVGNGPGVSVHFDMSTSDAQYRAPAGAWYNQNLVGATGTIRLTDGGGWLYFTGVKLETGSVATPYNHQSLAKSLADCQRYYQTFTNLILSGYNGATGAIYLAWPLAPPMRVAPTLAMSNLSYSNASNAKTWSISAVAWGVYMQITATGAGYCVVSNATLSSEI